jgi:Protein of unknown function (DUF2510)
LASAGLMVIGAFGPWVKAFAVSVGGTDGSNDGWLVVAAALIAALVILARREKASAGVWAILAGVAGAGTTIYDRSNVSSAISDAGPLAQSVVQVGWGLNLAMVASISLAIAGLASFAKSRAASSSSEPTATGDQVASVVPAGWYQDPVDSSLVRYWTGSAWTADTAKPGS